MSDSKKKLEERDKRISELEEQMKSITVNTPNNRKKTMMQGAADDIEDEEPWSTQIKRVILFFRHALFSRKHPNLTEMVEHSSNPRTIARKPSR